MPKAAITCSNSCGMGCFGTCFTHAQSCDKVHVRSATGRIASVHTLHMPKAVLTFMFKVLRKWAASVHTLHMPKAVITCSNCYGMGCFGTYFTHAQSCDNVRVQSTTEWVVFSPFRVFAVFAFSFFPISVLGVFAFLRFRVFAFRRRHPRGRDTHFVCTVYILAGAKCLF